MCSGNASGLYRWSAKGWSGWGIKHEGAESQFKRFGRGKLLPWTNSHCGWFLHFAGLHTLHLGPFAHLTQPKFLLAELEYSSPFTCFNDDIVLKTLHRLRTTLVSKWSNMLLISYWTWGLLMLLSHQVYQDAPAVLLSSPTPCGVIPPHSTVHIPLALETQVLGEYRSTVYISTFGSQDPPMVRANFQNCSYNCRTSCRTFQPSYVRHSTYLHIL